MPGASSISSQSDCCNPSAPMANSCDSSNRVVANTQCPKPTPSVWKPDGTSAESNGADASASPVTSSICTPHGAVVQLSRETPRAAHSCAAASVSSWPDDRMSSATASNAASSVASNPTN